ncbi:DUF6660 family protein [Lewinella sp. LCG006]|uniref:DUF6660 family protein n=1 Tax=Lewinella sp. LCG006 TaxID=3231911 RepID=UPI0034606DF3
MQQLVINILSFYMLILALIPCSDTADLQVLNTEITVTTTTSTHPDDHDHHSKDCAEDTCPPFCICDCCSGIISLPQMATIPLIVFTPKPGEAPSFTPNFPTSGVNNPIWSPPKL